jgi:hypothetical protein
MVELSEASSARFRTVALHGPEDAAAGARSAGLDVLDLQSATLRAELHDVGAIVDLLRLCPWWVPNFSVRRYGDVLRSLHERIGSSGPFVAHSTRFLIEACRPDQEPAATASVSARPSPAKA